MSTKVEYCDETWNFASGCTKISPGCQNCYAERMSKRLRGRFGYPADDPFRVTIHEHVLTQPYRWRAPRRIFVCSMSDPFHDAIPQAMRNGAWSIMANTPEHTYLVLTKRPQAAFRDAWLRSHQEDMLDNVWLGATAEDQARLYLRIQHLRMARVRHRFLSLEPLLGPVYLRARLDAISWVIVGGESGPSARPMHLDWVRSIIDDCRRAGIACFVKQAGSHWAKENHAKNRKGSDPSEWPLDLQVREYPLWRSK